MTAFGTSAARLSGASARLLGWKPDEFWSATPAELTIALSGGAETSGGIQRDEMEALVARFPDEKDDFRNGR